YENLPNLEDIGSFADVADARTMDPVGRRRRAASVSSRLGHDRLSASSSVFGEAPSLHSRRGRESYSPPDRAAGRRTFFDTAAGGARTGKARRAGQSRAAADFREEANGGGASPGGGAARPGRGPTSFFGRLAHVAGGG